jgi:hypothetical protein
MSALITILFSMIKFLLNTILKGIKVLIRYIRKDTFKLFNITSLSLSFLLMSIWIKIISSDKFIIDEHGEVI